MARSFNGTSDKIAQTNPGPTQFVNNLFSVSAWVYYTGGQSFPLICDGSSVGCLLGINIASSSGYNVYTNNLQTLNTASVSTNVWTHVAAVVSSASAATVYVNGTAQGGGVSGTASGSSIFSINIGANTGGNSFWKGSIADVAFWNIALTAAEVSALAKGARPYQIRPSGLTTWFPLDGLQSPEPDLSGNGRTGTLTGTALSTTAAPPVMMFSPRIPLVAPIGTLAAQTFQPAWAMRNRIIVEGIGI